MNGFVLGLGLKRRLRATRKWAIRYHYTFDYNTNISFLFKCS